MKYKKIMTVLLGFTLILYIAMGGVLAGIFPNPFVVNGNDDITIIYGANAASSDAVGANSIGSNLIAVWDSQQPEVVDDDSSTTIIIGDESYLIQSHGNDLNFLEELYLVDAKLTDKDLPMLLADGEVEQHDGEDVEYTQELILGDINKVTFGSLDSEDYIINEDLASNEVPMLYLDLNNPVWELKIDFEKSIDASEGELDDNAKIIIAGIEYAFDPNADNNDDLTLFGSTQELTIELQETKVITLGGEQVSITVHGADPDNREVLLIVDGEYETVREGDIINVNRERIYVNEVHIRTIPDNTVSVELFIGADEVEIYADDTYRNVKVNGKTLDGVEAKLDTNSITSFSEIWFRFTPTELDEDDYEEGLEFLEVGESIIDPLFGTIAMTFESVDSELDSEDRDIVIVKSRSDELEITFTNVDGDEIIFTPYIEDGGSLMYSPDLIINAALTDLKKDNEFILQISGDITDVFLIEDIDNGNQEVEIYSYAEEESEIYEVGDTIDGTGVSVTTIGVNKVTLNGNGDNKIITENKMEIILGIPTLITNEAILTFDEINMDDDENPIRASIEVTIELDSNDNIEITDVNSITIPTDITQASDDDNDMEYTLTNGFGTYFVRNDDTERLLEVYIPETETDMNVYISAGVEKVIVDNDTDTETIPTLTLNDIVFKDNDAALSEHNLIIVGGSCINSVAAKLLGSDIPLCEEDFTAVAGVGEGQYMIKTYVSPYNSEKIAVLVAGYEAVETTAGVAALLTEGFSIPAVGEHFIV